MLLLSVGSSGTFLRDAIRQRKKLLNYKLEKFYDSREVRSSNPGSRSTVRPIASLSDMSRLRGAALTFQWLRGLDQPRLSKDLFTDFSTNHN